MAVIFWSVLAETDVKTTEKLKFQQKRQAPIVKFVKSRHLPFGQGMVLYYL